MLPKRLVETYPDKIEALNLDDYQKESDSKRDLPISYNMINLDYLDLIRRDKTY